MIQLLIQVMPATFGNMLSKVLVMLDMDVINDMQ